MDTRIILFAYLSIGFLVSSYISFKASSKGRDAGLPVTILISIFWPIAIARIIYSINKFNKLKSK